MVMKRNRAELSALFFMLPFADPFHGSSWKAQKTVEKRERRHSLALNFFFLPLNIPEFELELYRSYNRMYIQCQYQGDDFMDGKDIGGLLRALMYVGKTMLFLLMFFDIFLRYINSATVTSKFMFRVAQTSYSAKHFTI